MMKSKRCYGNRYFFLLAVVALALSLRLWGITWGIPTRAMPFFLHPDETRVMDALSSLDIAQGVFTPVGGHMDGMLGYYAWISSIGAAKGLGFLDAYPSKTTIGDKDYFKTILVCRLLVVFFDLASICIVYFTLLRLGVSSAFCAIGAMVLAVIPIEVIYAHYMRPHILSNFFVSAVMYLTLHMHNSLRAQWRFFSGICCGMATATMYSGILTLVMPLSFVWYEDIFLKHKLSLSFEDFFSIVFNRSIVAIVFGFAFGFLACDPMILFDFRNALAPLANQWKEAANFGQLGNGVSFQFHKIFVYVSELIPKGAGPLLWVLLYISFVVAIIFARRHVFIASLASFIVVVVYGMGIAYFHRAEFVRTMIMIFPPLAVMFGWTAAWVWKRRTKTWERLGMAAILLCCFGYTLLFDGAYLRGMSLSGPREALVSFFREMPAAPVRHIGVVTTNWMSESIAHPLRVLQDEGKGTVTPISSNTPQELLDRQDFLCFVDFTVLGRDEINKKINSLLAGNTFVFDRVVQNKFCFFNVCFDAKALPHDMAYPFPIYIVLRATKHEPAS